MRSSGDKDRPGSPRTGGAEEAEKFAPWAVHPPGSVYFNVPVCYFVGPWNQHALREYLQHKTLNIEIRDRDLGDGVGRVESDAAIYGTGQPVHLLSLILLF